MDRKTITDFVFPSFLIPKSRKKSMWRNKNPLLFYAICCALSFWLPAAAATTSALRSTGRSFNETLHTDSAGTTTHIRRRLLDTTIADGNNERKKPIRILYTVTTLAEYDVGTRSTTRVSKIPGLFSWTLLISAFAGIQCRKMGKCRTKITIDCFCTLFSFYDFWHVSARITCGRETYL